MADIIPYSLTLILSFMMGYGVTKRFLHTRRLLKGKRLRAAVRRQKYDPPP